MSDLNWKESMKLKVTKLDQNALLPTRGSEYAAGLDLYSTVSMSLSPSERVLIPLNIAIELPNGTFGHILSRSGLALKHGIHVGAGVIDEDYRGNVGVLLFNLGDKPYTISVGDRIAQLVIKKYEKVDIVEEVLQQSDRGNRGFGSSGL